VDWVINPLVLLHWRGWGVEAVAFEQVSGEMAVFDALEAAVIACFESGPRGLQSLTEDLSVDLGLAPDAHLRARLQAIIEDFVARGWLQPTEPS
jgi:hypothetical protein